MPQTITAENINNFLDKDGYLNDISLWDYNIAEILAGLKNIKLSKDHYIILDTIRDFYLEYKTYPILRVFIKKLKLDKKLDESKCDSIYLNKILGETPIPMAGFLAGLPKSKKCIKF